MHGGKPRPCTNSNICASHVGIAKQDIGCQTAIRRRRVGNGLHVDVLIHVHDCIIVHAFILFLGK